MGGGIPAEAPLPSFPGIIRRRGRGAWGVAFVVMPILGLHKGGYARSVLSTGREDAKLRLLLLACLLRPTCKEVAKVGSVFSKNMQQCAAVQQRACFDWSNCLPPACFVVRAFARHSILMNIYTGIIISRFDAFGMKCESGDLSCRCPAGLRQQSRCFCNVQSSSYHGREGFSFPHILCPH